MSRRVYSDRLGPLPRQEVRDVVLVGVTDPAADPLAGLGIVGAVGDQLASLILPGCAGGAVLQDGQFGVGDGEEGAHGWFLRYFVAGYPTPLSRTHAVFTEDGLDQPQALTAFGTDAANLAIMLVAGDISETGDFSCEHGLGQESHVHLGLEILGKGQHHSSSSQ